MPSPLYNRAELRYNKRNRGEECRLKNRTRSVQKGAKTHSEHSDTVCYYRPRAKRCQTLLPKIFYFFRDSCKKDENRQIFKSFQDLETARTVAQEAAAAGKISVNGREVKPAYRVKVGDVVELQFSSGVLKFRVLELRETVKKDDAASLYEVIA